MKKATTFDELLELPAHVVNKFRQLYESVFISCNIMHQALFKLYTVRIHNGLSTMSSHHVRGDGRVVSVSELNLRENQGSYPGGTAQ